MHPERRPSPDRSPEGLEARLRALPPPPVPAELEARLLATIPAKLPAPRRRWPMWVSVVGALASTARKSHPAPNALALLKALRRRWLLAATCGLLASILAAAGVWFGMPMKYTASTILHVSVKEPKVLGGDAFPSSDFSIYQKTQAAMITSRLVLNAVLKDPEVAKLSILPRNPDAQIDWLQQELKVDFKTGPEFMKVSMVGYQPEEMKTLLNAITAVYLKEVVYKERTQKQARLSHLKEIQTKFEETLRTRRQAVRNLVLALGAGDAQVLAVKQRYAAEALGLAEKELHQVQSELRRLKIELNAKEGREQSLAPEVPEPQVEKAIDKEPEVVQLLAKREEHKKKLDQAVRLAVPGRAEPALKPMFDQLKTIEAELETVRSRLRPDVKERLLVQAGGHLSAPVAELRRRLEFSLELEKSLQESVDRLRKQTNSTNLVKTDVELFRLEIAQAEKLSERVAAEVENLKVEVDAPRRVDLLEDASASLGTLEQQRAKATAGAGVAALLFVVGLIVWREYRYRLLALLPLVLGVLTWSAVTSLHTQTPQPPDKPPPPAPTQKIAVRFQFTIDPKTPLKDLLPAPPKIKKITGPILGDDLTRVPEIHFQAAAAKDVPSAETRKQIAHQIAKINYLNDKKTDGFIGALRDERLDLHGLPFAMGDACRTKGERSQQFVRAVATVRQLLRSPRANQQNYLIWERYQTHCVQQDRRIRREQYETITLARIAALMQIFAPMSEMHPGLVKYLSTLSHVEATRALARLAIFSGDEEARKAALDALKVRHELDYTAILVEGLRYPWPAVARRAAEAIVKLERNDLLPKLVDLLEEPDPRAPVMRQVNQKRVPVVRELVRVNHHRSCLLCHAPGNTGKVSAGTLTAAVPVPGQPLTPPSGGYNTSQQDILVRLDVTYLRQDFSMLQPVADANPWPEMQRFDFLVRSRELTDEEAQVYREKLAKSEPAEFSPYQSAALAALRELTGRDTESTPEAWRRLLQLPADAQRQTQTP
jgi:capsular polysaccharide biosynthesis protein